MTDSNLTRSRQAEVFRANKLAFDDVLGDPAAIPEPIDGHYNTLRSRSSIKVARNNFDEGQATANPARPNVIDFTCDVDNVIGSVIKDKKLLHLFHQTYIFGSVELTQKERTVLEQEMGSIFRHRGISPVSRYFTTIRR